MRTKFQKTIANALVIPIVSAVVEKGEIDMSDFSVSHGSWYSSCLTYINDATARPKTLTESGVLMNNGKVWAFDRLTNESLIDIIKWLDECYEYLK